MPQTTGPLGKQVGSSCPTCGKTFKRRDVLLRHQKSHEAVSIETLGPVISRRACIECAIARARCSKTDPCRRCDEKKLQCSFPSTLSQQLAPSTTDINSKRNLGQIPVSPLHVEPNACELSEGTATACHSPKHGKVSEVPHYFETSESESRLAANIAALAPGDDNSSKNITQHEQPHFAHTNNRSLDSNNIEDVSLHPQAMQSTVVSSNSHAGSPGDQLLLGPGLNWIPLSERLSPRIDDYYQSFGEAFLPSVQQDCNMENHNEYNFARSSLNSRNGFWFNLPTIWNTSRVPTSERAISDVSVDESLRSISSKSMELGSARCFSYADGTGARTAKRRRVKRLKLHAQQQLPDHRQADMLHPRFTFPEIRLDEPYVADKDFETCISDADHHIILQYCHLLCEKPNFLYEEFGTGSFPSIQLCNVFVHLYFKNFHTVYPLLHRETFTNSNVNWLLKLAVIATGATFADLEHHVELCESLQEYLRRAINMQAEQGKLTALLDHYQAQVLNIVGMSQCRSSSLRARADSGCSSLVTICTEVLGSKHWQSASGGSHHYEAYFAENLASESWVRLVFISWIFLNVLSLGAQRDLVLWTQIGEVQLPSHDSVWEMPLVEARTRTSSSEHTFDFDTLYSAMQTLYLTKSISPKLGDISQTIMVYAVCDKTREMGFQCQQRLSVWHPTSAPLCLPAQDANSSFSWLPADAIFASWRNGACDCLDVLHWHANSLAAKNAGMEPPVILHLHLARLVLLTPFRDIRTLAENIVSAPREMVLSYHDRIQQAIEGVKKWLVLDQCKARLAVVHAGAIFWSIRNFTTGNLIEPQSLLLATLILWCYGTHRDRLSRSSMQEAANEIEEDALDIPQGSLGDIFPAEAWESEFSDSPDSSSDGETIPEIISIDRPCDDQLIQHFVRKGDNMTVMLARVGSLCAAKGPKRALLEGARLLCRHEQHWGIYAVYQEFLVNLAQATITALD